MALASGGTMKIKEQGSRLLGAWLVRLALVCLVPSVVGLAAVSLRRAQGPFWLATNQDPAYSYVFDSLRVAFGDPPNHMLHPGTVAHLIGAGVLRVQHLGQGQPDLARRVLADPERALAAIHAVFVGACLAALAVLGWVVLSVTRSLVLCWLAQAAPFLAPGTLGELAEVKPEPLLLALSLSLAALMVWQLAPDAAVPRQRPLLAGAIVGLALGAKFTAAPLALVPLLALDSLRSRLRFSAGVAASFLLATLPVIPRLARAVDFLLHAAGGPGAYGSGLLAAAYGSALRAALLHSAPVLVVAAVGLVTAIRCRMEPRERRLLLGVAGAQAMALAVLLRQPYGGTRYLVPVAGLFGLSLMLLARAWVPDAAGRPRRVLAVLGLAAVALLGWHEGRAFSGSRGHAGWLARQQQRAARVARRGVGECVLVAYHKASSVPSALLFGFGRPAVDPGHLALLQELYPWALFLDYVRHSDQGGLSSFRFVPYEAWVVPRLRSFGAALDAQELFRGRPCVVFQGSSGGPGRLYVSSAFARESIPYPGRVEPIYGSATESLYRLELEAR